MNANVGSILEYFDDSAVESTLHMRSTKRVTDDYAKFAEESK